MPYFFALSTSLLISKSVKFIVFQCTGCSITSSSSKLNNSTHFLSSSNKLTIEKKFSLSLYFKFLVERALLLFNFLAIMSYFVIGLIVSPSI